MKWEFTMTDITWGGVLSTATDLVFSGGRDGYFFALDGRTGALLWKAPVGGQVNAGGMSYAVNGKQYVAIAAGNAVAGCRETGFGLWPGPITRAATDN
jgi:glucose dehydrogenase